MHNHNIMAKSVIILAADGRGLARGVRADEALQRQARTRDVQLSHLQAGMEALLRSKGSSCHSSTMWEARFISEVAAAVNAVHRSKIILLVNLMSRLDKTSIYFLILTKISYFLICFCCTIDFRVNLVSDLCGKWLTGSTSIYNYLFLP